MPEPRCRRWRNCDVSVKRLQTSSCVKRPWQIRWCKRSCRCSQVKSKKSAESLSRRLGRTGWSSNNGCIGGSMAGGWMGNLGNMGNIMKQAQAMQEQLAKLQAEVATKTVQVSSGGGIVTIVANGAMEIVSIKIDPEFLKGNDVEMLQDLVMAATNEALRKAREMVAEEMKGVTGGLQIPGLL